MPDCTCQHASDGNRVWCERHQIWKTAHWVQLCQTRPEYRALWDAGRGPGQGYTPDPSVALQAAAGTARAEELDFLPWLRCPKRGTVLGQVRKSLVGCGCGSETVPYYQCELFAEPVVKWANRSRRPVEEIARYIPGYAGRTCQTCETAEAKGETEIGQEAGVE